MSYGQDLRGGTERYGRSDSDGGCLAMDALPNAEAAAPVLAPARTRNAQAHIEGCFPVRSLGLLHQSALVAREHHVGYPVTRTRTRTVPLTRILESAHKNGPVLDWTATCLGSTIVRRSEEGTAAMEAGGVYHLLAQARHLEEIQPVRGYPKSVELRRFVLSWRPIDYYRLASHPVRGKLQLNEKGHLFGRDLECGTDVLGMASLLEAGSK